MFVLKVLMVPEPNSTYQLFDLNERLVLSKYIEDLT